MVELSHFNMCRRGLICPSRVRAAAAGAATSYQTVLALTAPGVGVAAAREIGVAAGREIGVVAAREISAPRLRAAGIRSAIAPTKTDSTAPPV